MRYIGSKVATLPHLEEMVKTFAPDAQSICDPFAGICSVSRHFKRAGLRVCTGDMMQLSHVIQISSVGLNHSPQFRRLVASGTIKRGEAPAYLRVISHLASLPGYHGYVTEHFSPAGTVGRFFFTHANAMKIDAMRETIRQWSAQRLLSANEEAFLLATLVTSADKIANTAGTYYAHLKQLSRKAARPLVLSPIQVLDNRMRNSCHNADAEKIVASSDADILYLDPPYNERDYSRYYHLPETIVRGDWPEPQGRSGAPKERQNPISEFCVASLATSAFERLVSAAKAKSIIVHYTINGLIPHRAIRSILSSLGPTKFNDIRVRAYTAIPQAGRTQCTHRIYWCDRSASSS
jgi:adenine-specific DNA-methyltransferase